MALKNKKAMFFTVSTILLVSLLLTAFTLNEEKDKDRDLIKKRVNTMNYFIEDFERDIERASEIIGSRALTSITDNIVEKREFSDNVNKDFKELFINSTLDGQESRMMNNTNLALWLNKVKEKADYMNIISNISIISIDIYQTDPWFVEIRLKADIELKDKSDIAEFRYNKTIKSKISIKGLEDPLYSINTLGKVPNIIKKSPYSNFIENNKTEKLLNHTLSQHYIASDLGPSYLDRLEGKTTANDKGIESLVNIENLVNNNINIEEKSVVDYIYFSDLNPKYYNIQGLPIWFRLDQEHISIYDCEGLTE